MLYNLISVFAKFQLSEFVFFLYKKLFSLFLFTCKSKFSTFLEFIFSLKFHIVSKYNVVPIFVVYSFFNFLSFLKFFTYSLTSIPLLNLEI